MSSAATGPSPTRALVTAAVALLKKAKEGNISDEALAATEAACDALRGLDVTLPAAITTETVADWAALTSAVVASRCATSTGAERLFEVVKAALRAGAVHMGAVVEGLPAARNGSGQVHDISDALAGAMVRALDRNQPFYRFHGLPGAAGNAAGLGPGCIPVDERASPTEVWRDDLRMGVEVDFWHDKLRTWVTTMVLEVTAACMVRLSFAGLPSPTSLWFHKYERILAAPGTRTPTRDAILSRQPWRLGLKLGDELDVMDYTARWGVGRVLGLKFVDGTTTALPPSELPVQRMTYAAAAGQGAGNKDAAASSGAAANITNPGAWFDPTNDDASVDRSAYTSITGSAPAPGDALQVTIIEELPDVPSEPKAEGPKIVTHAANADADDAMTAVSQDAQATATSEVVADADVDDTAHGDVVQAQVQYDGWTTSHTEWLDIASLRVAPVRTRSYGRAAFGLADYPSADRDDELTWLAAVPDFDDPWDASTRCVQRNMVQFGGARLAEACRTFADADGFDALVRRLLQGAALPAPADFVSIYALHAGGDDAFLLALHAPVDSSTHAPMQPSLLAHALQLLQAGAPFFTARYSRSLAAPVRDGSLRSLLLMNEAELRNLSLDNLHAIGQALVRTLVRSMPGHIVTQALEQTSVDMILKMLDSSLLAQRVNAMKLMTEVVSAVRVNRSAFLSQDGLVEWLKRTKLVERFFLGEAALGKYTTIGTAENDGHLYPCFLAESQRKYHPCITPPAGITSPPPAAAVSDGALRPTHPELLRRVSDVVRFLVYTKHLPLRLLDAMFSAAVHTEDRDTVDAIVKVLDTACWEMSAADLQHVLMNASSLPATQLSSQVLDLVKRYGTITQHVPTLGPIALDVLWKLLLPTVNGVPVPADIAANAEGKVIEMLQMAAMRALRLTFIRRALQYVRERTAVPRMLRVLRGVIDMFPLTAGTQDLPIRSNIVETLNKEDDIVTVLLEDLIAYKQAAAAAVLSMGAVSCARASGSLVLDGTHCSLSHQQAGDTDASLARRADGSAVALDSLIVTPEPGALSHQVAVALRLQFLKYIVTASPLKLTYEQLDIVFVQLYVLALTKEERRAVLAFLADGVTVTGTGTMFDVEVTARFFSQRVVPGSGEMPLPAPSAGTPLTIASADAAAVIAAAREGVIFLPSSSTPEEDAATMTRAGFNVFRGFMLAINAQQGRLLRLAESECDITCDPRQLVGLEHLWRVALLSLDSDVADSAITLLNMMHTQLSDRVTSPGTAVATRVSPAQPVRRPQPAQRGSATDMLHSIIRSVLLGQEGVTVLNFGADEPVAGDGSSTSPIIVDDASDDDLAEAIRISLMDAQQAGVLPDVAAGDEMPANRPLSNDAAAPTASVDTSPPALSSDSSTEEDAPAVSQQAVTAAYVTRCLDELQRTLLHADHDDAAARTRTRSRVCMCLHRLLDWSDGRGYGLVLRPHAARVRGARMRVKFVNAIVAVGVIRSDCLPETFGLTLYANSTVWDVRTAISTRSGFAATRVGLLRDRVDVPDSDNAQTLSALGWKATDTISVTLRSGKIAKALPLITDLSIRGSEWALAQFTPSAERALTEIFNRYATDGGMTREGLQTYFESCGVKEKDWRRIDGIFFDHKVTGQRMTVVEFLSFYRQAAVTRDDAVYKDLHTHGYDDYFRRVRFDTPQSIAMGLKAESDASATSSSDMIAVQTAANDPRAIIGSRSDCYTALFQLFDATGADAASQLVVDAAWKLLLRLPTDPALVAQLSLGTELFAREAHIARAVLAQLPALEASAAAGRLAAVAAATRHAAPPVWEHVLSTASPQRLLYVAQVLESLMHSEPADAGDAAGNAEDAPATGSPAAAPSPAAPVAPSSADAASAGGSSSAGASAAGSAGASAAGGGATAVTSAAPPTAATAAPPLPPPSTAAPASPPLAGAATPSVSSDMPALPPLLSLTQMPSTGDGSVDSAAGAARPRRPRKRIITPTVMVALPRAAREAAEVEERAAASEWRARFVASGGFRQLLHTLFKVPLASAGGASAQGTSMDFLCVGGVAKLVHAFLGPALSARAPITALALQAIHDCRVVEEAAVPLPVSPEHEDRAGGDAPAETALPTAVPQLGRGLSRASSAGWWSSLPDYVSPADAEEVAAQMRGKLGEVVISSVDFDLLQATVLRMLASAMRSRTSEGTAAAEAVAVGVEHGINVWLAAALHRPNSIMTQLVRLQVRARARMSVFMQEMAQAVDAAGLTNGAADDSTTPLALDGVFMSLLLCGFSMKIRQLAESMLYQLGSHLPYTARPMKPTTPVHAPPTDTALPPASSLRFARLESITDTSDWTLSLSPFHKSAQGGTAEGAEPPSLHLNGGSISEVETADPAALPGKRSSGSSTTARDALLDVLLVQLPNIRIGSEDAMAPCEQYFSLLNSLLREATGLNAFAAAKASAARATAVSNRAARQGKTASATAATTAALDAAVQDAARASGGKNTYGLLPSAEYAYVVPLLRYLARRLVIHPAAEAAIFVARHGLTSGASVALASAAAAASSSTVPVMIGPMPAPSSSASAGASTPSATDASSADDDEVLIGYLQLMSTLLEAFPGTRALLSSPTASASDAVQDLVRVVFSECLFRMPTVEDTMRDDFDLVAVAPKCIRQRSRGTAFQLLVRLCDGAPAGLAGLVRSLQDVIAAATRFTGFANSFARQTRSDTGFVGLRNLGCICYMNASLQQLFMIPHFRYGLLSVWNGACSAIALPEGVASQVQPASAPAALATVPLDGSLPPNENEVDDMLFQLQRMFGFLCLSDRQDYNPRAWTVAFKDFDGNPTPVNVQQDATEFFSRLLDQIESSLRGTAQAGLVQTVCAGSLTYEKRCTKCGTASSTEDPFVMLKLEIKNVTDVYGALQQLCAEERIEGVQCDTCNDKITASRQPLLGKLPNTLFLNFNRLVFNYDTFTREKINTRMEFPEVLHLDDFVREARQARAATAAAASPSSDSSAATGAAETPLPGDVASTGGATPASPTTAAPPATSPEYEYRLMGVVCHTGSAEAGHYYSYIKDRASGAWNEFNDSRVTRFDPRHIDAECFGGVQEYTDYYDVVSKRETVRNAYICVYERVASSALLDAVDVARAGNGMAPVSASTVAPDLVTAADASAPLSVTGQDAFRAWLRSTASTLRNLDTGSRHGAAAISARTAQLLRCVVCKPIYRLVAQDNLTFAQDRIIYSAEFFKFMGDLVAAICRSVQPSALAVVGADEPPKLTVEDVMTVADSLDAALDFVMDILLHAERPGAHVQSIVRSIVKVMTLDGDAAAFPTQLNAYREAAAVEVSSRVLQRFIDKPAQLLEALLQCTEEPVRQQMALLVGCALRTLCATRASQAALVDAAMLVRRLVSDDGTAGGEATLEALEGGAAVPADGSNPLTRCTLGRFLIMFTSLVPDATKNWPRFRDYFSVLASFANAAVTRCANTLETASAQVDAFCVAPPAALMVQPVLALLLAAPQLLAQVGDAFLGDDSPLADTTRKSPIPATSVTAPAWDPAMELFSTLVRAYTLFNFPQCSVVTEAAEAAASAARVSEFAVHGARAPSTLYWDAGTRTVWQSLPRVRAPSMLLSADDESIVTNVWLWIRALNGGYAVSSLCKAATYASWQSTLAWAFFNHVVSTAVSNAVGEGTSAFTDLLVALLGAKDYDSTQAHGVLHMLERTACMLGDPCMGTELQGVAMGLPALPVGSFSPRTGSQATDDSATTPLPEESKTGDVKEEAALNTDGKVALTARRAAKRAAEAASDPEAVASSEAWQSYVANGAMQEWLPLADILPLPEAACVDADARTAYLESIGIRPGSGIIRAIYRRRNTSERTALSALMSLITVAERVPVVAFYLLRLPAWDPLTDTRHVDWMLRFMVRQVDLAYAFSYATYGSTPSKDDKSPLKQACDEMARLLSLMREGATRAAAVAAREPASPTGLQLVVSRAAVPPHLPAGARMPTDIYAARGGFIQRPVRTGLFMPSGGAAVEDLRSYGHAITFASAFTDPLIWHAVRNGVSVASSQDKSLIVVAIRYSHPYAYGCGADSGACPHARQQDKPACVRHAGWTHLALKATSTLATDMIVTLMLHGPADMSKAHEAGTPDKHNFVPPHGPCIFRLRARESCLLFDAPALDGTRSQIDFNFSWQYNPVPDVVCANTAGEGGRFASHSTFSQLAYAGVAGLATEDRVQSAPSASAARVGFDNSSETPRRRRASAGAHDAATDTGTHLLAGSKRDRRSDDQFNLEDNRSLAMVPLSIPDAKSKLSDYDDDRHVRRRGASESGEGFIGPELPAPSAPADAEWPCTACTYLNYPLAQVCEVCGSPR